MQPLSLTTAGPCSRRLYWSRLCLLWCVAAPYSSHMLLALPLASASCGLEVDDTLMQSSHNHPLRLSRRGAMEITPRRGPGASLRGFACSPRHLRLLQEGLISHCAGVDCVTCFFLSLLPVIGFFGEESITVFQYMMDAQPVCLHGTRMKINCSIY
ncbi:hypothetical protein VPH35_051596 [Triticum aestivum]